MADIQIAVIDEKDTQITLAVPGVQGPSGAISSGGSANQVFYKVSGTNYDAGWTFIGNANVDAAAAIAGTKISPNFGSQTIATTGVFSHALGAAATPSLTFTGDLNTGIYSPGADQVAVATNGTQRLTVDTAATTSTLPVVHPLGAVGTPSITFTGDLNTGFYSPAADTLAAVTAGSNRLHITSGGLVGIGTSGPGEALTVANGALQVSGTLSSLNRPSSSVMDFQISTGLTRFFSIGADASTHGSYAFCTATTTANIERVKIDQSGRVGIGATPVVDLDVAPAASTATFRIHARSNTTPVAAIELVRGTSTTFGADGSGDYRIKNDSGNLSFEYGDSGVTSERARIDASGRLLIGTSTARANFYNSTNSARFQIEGSGSNDNYTLSIVSNFAGNTNGAQIILAKSRGSNVGDNTLTVSGDTIGQINFQGADGTEFVEAASISAEVDGEPGTSGDATDMPGRLVFATTADGAPSSTEALRITNDRVIAYNQPTPTSKSAAATLTITELKTGIIQYTGAVATLTLPTGTLMEGGFSGIYTNMAFEWSVINTGAGICTVAAGTDHTVIGSGTVAIGASARFVSRRTAANTFVSYCLS